MSKNPLLQTMIAMTGQNNVITVHRPFVEFTGTLEAAMMLSQLLYWTPKSTMPGGWIAKSDKEWKKELCLTRYSSRAAAQTLEDMKIIETHLKKFNGSPTIHYRVKWETLEKKWLEWLRLSENGQTDYLKTDNPLSENGQSLTETTTETTTKIQEEEGKPAKTQNLYTLYEHEVGALTPLIADALDDAEKTFGVKWVCDAITEAAKNNARNWKYVEAILKRWKAQGNQERMKKAGATPAQNNNMAILQAFAEKG